jgi:hypothetical protein
MKRTLFVLLAFLTLSPLFNVALSNKVYFELIKEFTLESEPRDIILYDNAYVISDGALYVISISDPYNASKSEIGSLSGLKSLAFIGHYAYAAYSGGIIGIYDFTKSVSTRTNSINSMGRIQKIFIDNGYLYITNLDAGLQVYDVNIADFPVYKNTQVITGEPNGLVVKNKKAYVTSSNAHLSIIDVSDLSKLSIVGTYTNGVSFYEPFVDGNYAYVPQGNTGVQVLNINNLPFPNMVTILFARKSAIQAVTSSNYVWVADNKSIEAFFNSNGDAFFFAGNYKSTSVINRIAVVDGKFIYAATADKKLKILKIDYQY